jgi:hypothetical protein
MEMHLVHWKMAYGSLTAAKTHSDGLAVLSLLFEADHDNHDYDALVVTRLCFRESILRISLGQNILKSAILYQ